MQEFYYYHIKGSFFSYYTEMSYIKTFVMAWFFTEMYMKFGE